MQTKSAKRARVRQNRPKAEVPRYPSGARKPEPANDVAIESRMCRMGLRDTPENRAIARDPMQGCAVGRAIIAAKLPQQESNALWQAVGHARKAYVTFDRAIGAPNRHAQCLRILQPVDAMQADAASPETDTRSAEERYRQSVSCQMRVVQWIGHCDNPAQQAFLRAVIDEPDMEAKDWPGILACLRCICEGLDGKPVKIRVRK